MLIEQLQSFCLCFYWTSDLGLSAYFQHALCSWVTFSEFIGSQHYCLWLYSYILWVISASPIPFSLFGTSSKESSFCWTLDNCSKICLTLSALLWYGWWWKYFRVSIISSLYVCSIAYDDISHEVELFTFWSGKLREIGNCNSGQFGMSADNFKAVKDPNTGSYSIPFQC